MQTLTLNNIKSTSLTGGNQFVIMFHPVLLGVVILSICSTSKGDGCTDVSDDAAKHIVVPLQDAINFSKGNFISLKGFDMRMEGFEVKLGGGRIGDFGSIGLSTTDQKPAVVCTSDGMNILNVLLEFQKIDAEFYNFTIRTPFFLLGGESSTFLSIQGLKLRLTSSGAKCDTDMKIVSDGNVSMKVRFPPGLLNLAAQEFINIVVAPFITRFSNMHNFLDRFNRIAPLQGSLSQLTRHETLCDRIRNAV